MLLQVFSVNNRNFQFRHLSSNRFFLFYAASKYKESVSFLRTLGSVLSKHTFFYGLNISPFIAKQEKNTEMLSNISKMYCEYFFWNIMDLQ